MSVHAAPALATVQPGYSFAIPPPTQIDNVNMFIKQEQMTAVTAAAAAAAAVAANAANAANAAIAAQHHIPATGEKRSPAKKRRSPKKQMAAAVATGEEATTTVSVTGEMSTAQPIPMATGQSASDVHVDNAGDGENTGEIAAGNQVAQAAPSGSNGTEKWKSRQPRPCDHCDRIFSNKFNLKQHVMNMHTPGGTVACEICKKRVKNKWYLRRHQVTHHNAPLKK